MTGTMYGESTDGWRIPCEKLFHVIIGLQSRVGRFVFLYTFNKPQAQMHVHYLHLHILIDMVMKRV